MKFILEESNKFKLEERFTLTETNTLIESSALDTALSWVETLSPNLDTFEQRVTELKEAAKLARKSSAVKTALEELESQAVEVENTLSAPNINNDVLKAELLDYIKKLDVAIKSFEAANPEGNGIDRGQHSKLIKLIASLKTLVGSSPWDDKTVKKIVSTYQIIQSSLKPTYNIPDIEGPINEVEEFKNQCDRVLAQLASLEIKTLGKEDFIEADMADIKGCIQEFVNLNKTITVINNRKAINIVGKTITKIAGQLQEVEMVLGHLAENPIIQSKVASVTQQKEKAATEEAEKAFTAEKEKAAAEIAQYAKDNNVEYNKTMVNDIYTAESEKELLARVKAVKDLINKYKEIQVKDAQNEAAHKWDKEYEQVKHDATKETAFWGEYYATEWEGYPEQIVLAIRQLIEPILKSSDNGFSYPVLDFIKFLKTTDRLDLFETETTPKLSSIINAYTRDFLSEKDLIGAGKLGESNLIFNQKFYDKNSTAAWLKYLKLQAKFETASVSIAKARGITEIEAFKKVFIETDGTLKPSSEITATLKTNGIDFKKKTPLAADEVSNILRSIKSEEEAKKMITYLMDAFSISASSVIEKLIASEEREIYLTRTACTYADTQNFIKKLKLNKQWTADTLIKLFNGLADKVTGANKNED